MPLSLTICSITKNEEAAISNLLICITKTAPDEIIIIDESIDNTRNIINSFNITNGTNIKIIDGKWNENYGELRNFAISQCTKDWILFIDADEILEDELINELKKRNDGSRLLLEHYENLKVDIVAFPRKNFIDNEFKKELSCIEAVNIQVYPDFQHRLIRNNGKIKYGGYVHEMPNGFTKRDECLYHLLHYRTYEKWINVNKKYEHMCRKYGISI
jgi:glycosyltransferase involved in cell wall biosynthesis